MKPSPRSAASAGQALATSRARLRASAAEVAGHPARVEPAGDRAAVDQRPDQGRLLGGQPFPRPPGHPARPLRGGAHRRAAPARVAAAIASSSAASSASGG